MEVTVIKQTDTLTHIALEGRMDVVSSEALNLELHKLIASRGRPTIVDLTKLQYITSYGIGIMISCSKTLKSKDKGMVFFNPHDVVERVLRSTNIQTVIPIVKKMEDALEHLQIKE